MKIDIFKDGINSKVSLHFCCMKLFKNMCREHIPIINMYEEVNAGSWGDMFQLSHNESKGKDIIRYSNCPFCGELTTHKLINKES